MSTGSAETPHAYIPVDLRGAVICAPPDVLWSENGEPQGLNITIRLSGKDYQTHLPARAVGPTGGPKDIIFPLDLSRNKEFSEAASTVLAEFIAESRALVIVSLRSHTSISCIREAMRQANQQSTFSWKREYVEL